MSNCQLGKKIERKKGKIQFFYFYYSLFGDYGKYMNSHEEILPGEIIV